ncbi:MAG: FAD-dependent tricarballylate dehydrogenase TcuA [Anaerolineae bacterium]
MELKHEVIVVGGGNAALTAAISAMEAGARVLIVEKAPQTERGGNTKSTASYRFAYNGLEDVRSVMPQLTDEEADSIEVGQFTTDQYYNHLMLVSDGLADPEFTQVLVNESYSTIRWLAGLGVKFDIWWEFGKPGPDGKTYFEKGCPTCVAGGGAEIVRTLFGVAEKMGATILYETKATKLLIDETGRVCGVRLKDRAGFRDVKSKAVILGCGGFESSREMRTKYLGPGWDLVKVRGTNYNTGDGLNMALEIGAGTTGHFSAAHACPVFLEGPAFEMGDTAIGHGYPHSIMVNILGKRFADEGEDYFSLTYAKLGVAVLEQPKGSAFQVFDANGIAALPSGLARRYQQTTPVTANSIEELADKMGVDKTRLVTTVREFNAAVQDTPFNPSILDGKGTVGIEPPKSNWALPIDTPPFVAYPTTCGITFTYGGLKTNTKAQVLDTEDNVIPALYAVGELAGSFYFNYVGGSGLPKGAVYGRIAGRHAAGQR